MLTKVICSERLFHLAAFGSRQSGDMSLAQVLHMNKVSDGSPVRSIPVGSENVQDGSFAG
jgi:hypothetical protein